MNWYNRMTLHEKNDEKMINRTDSPKAIVQMITQKNHWSYKQKAC
jgi:hypothetical protein